MTTNDLRFRVQGPDAEALARAVRDVLARELGEAVDCTQETGSTNTAVVRDVDALAVATFIVALPGTALAVVDLASRLKLRSKVEGLLARLRDTAASQPGHRVEMRSGAMWQDWRPIETVAPEDVLATRDEDADP